MADWPIPKLYFGIVMILSLIGWTGLARVVRGKFMALREEDFVMIARLHGSRELRIIFRHLLPSFTSHVIANRGAVQGSASSSGPADRSPRKDKR